MKPTLLILAAGMGSRYGGLKQLDGVGPKGETIMDYSVYDAIQAGFGKVVFVIRKSFHEDFEEQIAPKFSDKIEIAYAFQEVDVPVQGVEKIPPRLKPWGTAHAVLMAENVIREPFAVINADDYYGASSYRVVADFLQHQVKPDHYAMVGFVLKNTLSDNGSVSRGVCEMNEDNILKTVVERHKVQRQDGKVTFELDGRKHEVKDDSLVSMNFWGFHPNIFEEIRRQFVQFVKNNSDNPKAEFYIPLVINDLVQRGAISLTVLLSEEQWYGVTYQEDKPSVQKALSDMVSNEKYPDPLWK